jgi:hypothetical protein
MGVHCLDENYQIIRPILKRAAIYHYFVLSLHAKTRCPKNASVLDERKPPKPGSCPERNPYLNGLIWVGDERLLIHIPSKEGKACFRDDANGIFACP